LSFPLEITKSFIEKYNSSGPYYVSYPTVGQWSKFSSIEYEEALIEVYKNDKNRPVKLYVHYPFCVRLCHFCHCHVMISRNKKRIDSFLDVLLKEIDMLQEFFEKNSLELNFKDIHLGGGSPSYLDEEGFDLLIDKLGSLLDMDKLVEFSIEVDPRTVTPSKICHYSEKGINRLSFGIQDFNPAVQKAIDRVQPLEEVEALITSDIRKKFESINFDLMFGLPHQTRESFQETIDNVIRILPERIALFHFNHRTDIFENHSLIKDNDLPGEYEKSMINIEAISRLLDAGYERVGLDHFALPQDALAQAAQAGTVSRNFNGYTRGGTVDLIGVGPSAISGFSDYYFQNIYAVDDYCSSIDSAQTPILRGIRLTKDQKIREEIILSFISGFNLDVTAIEQKYGIEFKVYFQTELEPLEVLVKDKIIEWSDNYISVTQLGKFCVRYVCMVFDQMLQEGKKHRPTSKKDDLMVEAG
jgi:oxygen-independent coproporphyrinogen-3 oxidase